MPVSDLYRDTVLPDAPGVTAVAPDVSILLVDDRQENLDVLAVLLGRPGLHILQARSGRAALELLLEHDVALALLDVHMPEIDGFELAELMRGAERTRTVPIIFVTAASPATDRIFRGYEAGAVDFLCKPFNPHLLQSKVNVFIDLFAQRQQLAAQVEEHKALTRTAALLIGVLSHDLRAPLGAISMAGDLLAQSHADDPRITQLTSRIQSSSKRMTRMIEQLLDFAAARAGGLPTRPQAADLRELANAALVEFQAARDRLQLTIDGDVTGRWDPDRLQQVLSNLIGNAIQHGDATQPVTIEVDGRQADVVTLRVSNAGVIPESRRATLFSPFAQGESESHGTGLGLYIVDSIARAHGGSVAATCTGESTAVVVELPRLA